MAGWTGGGIQIAFPDVDENPCAVSIEYSKVFSQAANTSPFSQQQQWQDWGNSHVELSVSMGPMTAAQGSNFLWFLDNLNGSINVFTFPNSFCTDVRWSYLLTYNAGTILKYFRLSKPQNRAVIKPGGAAGLYESIIFECREAV
jgi:hypothetical protein